METSITPGSDNLVESGLQLPGKLGLLTNAAAKTASLQPSRKALLEKGYEIIRLFSPEHGLEADQPDGARVQNQLDAVSGLPVVSLYGTHLKPSLDDLKDLRGMLVDIPDIGCRFYTYLWSMTYVMEACREADIPVWILDRPNPIGGRPDLAEGPWLDEKNCSSFIGRWNIPIRHSATPGELARYFAATRLPGLQLQVIPCRGWSRRLSFLESGQIFTPTSPAMRDAETTLLYPGTGLLEGINVNEGRGTATPFKVFGAPWLQADKLFENLKKAAIPGLNFQKTQFTPEWGMYAGQVCRGITLHITDPSVFRPVKFGLTLLKALMELHENEITPRRYATIANPAGNDHLDRLTGISQSFNLLQAGHIPNCNVLPKWQNEITPFLIYQ